MRNHTSDSILDDPDIREEFERARPEASEMSAAEREQYALRELDRIRAERKGWDKELSRIIWETDPDRWVDWTFYKNGLEVGLAIRALAPSFIARERGLRRQLQREERDEAIVQFAFEAARKNDSLRDSPKNLPAYVARNCPQAKAEDLSETTVANILKRAKVKSRIRKGDF